MGANELRLFERLDCTVGSFLGTLEEDTGHLLLITSLDSDRDTASIVRSLVGENSCEDIEGFALVSWKQLPSLLERRIFVHFDEAWLFRDRPNELRLPLEDFSLVAPLDSPADIISGAAQWMNSTGCVLGIGDGEGMNALVPTNEVALLAALESCGNLPAWGS